MNSRTNVSDNTTAEYDMDTESCISTGKVTLAFGITALLFSIATAYKVAVFGQPAFFLGAVPLMIQTPDPPSAVVSDLYFDDRDDDKIDDLLDDVPWPSSSPGFRQTAQPQRMVIGLSIDRLEDRANDLAASARDLSLLVEGR